jgi:hypothetical protein
MAGSCVIARWGIAPQAQGADGGEMRTQIHIIKKTSGSTSARYASSMKESKRRRSSALLFSGLVLVLCVACKSEKSDDARAADSAEPLASGEHKAKRVMPTAVFDACQGKAVGDACSVQFGSRTIEAKCAAVPDGRLACRRERGEHRPPEGS